MTFGGKLTPAAQLRKAVQTVQGEQDVVSGLRAPMERRTVRMTNAAVRATAAGSQAIAATAAATKEATYKAKAKLMSGAIDLNEENNADLVIARHLWQDHRLLPPVSEGRARWAKLLVLLTLYTSFIIPLRVAFGQLDGVVFTVVEIVVDLCFVLDILVNFRTAAFTRDYELIFEPKAIAGRYAKSYAAPCLPSIILHSTSGRCGDPPLRCSLPVARRVCPVFCSGWFVVDVLASLPLDWVALGWEFRPVLQLNRLLRLSCARSTHVHACARMRRPHCCADCRH